MLFGRDAWERVRGRIQEAGLAVQPLLLEPDGSLADGDFQAAWFSPELFALKQDEAFLAAVLGCPTVRWMQSGRSGFDHPAFAQLARRGVRLSRSTAPAPAIAEYVIASVFDRFQRGPERRLAQQAQEWRPLPFKEIAGSRWLCIGFGEIGILGNQGCGAHHHARRAETALQAVAFAKRGLHGMQRAVGREPFDGGDVGALGLHGEHVARLHGAAVQMDGAGAALRGVAADVGAGQAQLVA